MKSIALHAVLMGIFCSVVTSVTFADTLIYNNSNYGGYFTLGYNNYEVFDFGSSPGGLVKKFSFGYRNPSSATSWVRITFYRSLQLNYYEPGYAVKSIFIQNIPASSSSYRVYEHVLAEADRFELPNGTFGYTVAVSSSTTNLALASGGAGQENELWEYLSGWGWDPFWFGGSPWAGLYMKIYTGPPINEITCDISGYKFNDSNGNGVWNAGEPALPGWELYLDTNSNGTYEASEPNEVTDPNGFYLFKNIASPATYRIREITKSGWTQTLPGSATNYQYVVATDPNHAYGPYNFGNKVGSGTTIRLKAIEDTYARSSQPDTNFGSATSFTAGMEGTTEYQAFIKFDLSSIPPGQVITSAKLLLDGSFVTPVAPLVGAFRIYDDWDEGTLTWNNKPSAYDEITPIDQKTASIDITTLNVTLDVDTDYGYKEPYSVQVKRAFASPSNTRASFWSKDLGNPDMAPTLEIQYEPIFGGGSGEEGDPFLIYTGQQMYQIGLYPHRWQSHYKLMADISLAAYTGTAYKRIGLAAPTVKGLASFKGVFDGNYHTISGFSYASSSTNNIGLFGYVYQGVIKNLKLIAPSITNLGSTSYVGPLAGYLDDADVYGCSVQGGTVAGTSYTGGLVGFIKASCVAECDSSASVSGGKDTGGLAGLSTAGGLTRISDCYASGSVSGTDYVGGFVGDSSDTTIVNCYSKGLVTGTSNTGGFSGYNSNVLPFPANVTACFWDTQTSGKATSAAGTGKTTTAMKTLSTFSNAGWDFVNETANGGSDSWSLSAGSYPVFWRQLASPPALPVFAGGNGSAATPYLVATANQLNGIGHNPRLMDKHFKLTADMDMDGVAFRMIGERPYHFSGTLNGDDHVVGQLNLTSNTFYNGFGFIGSLKGSQAQIRNLTLKDATVHNEWAACLGAMTGKNKGGTLENCHIQNSSVYGGGVTGGLIGVNYLYGTVRGCSVLGGTVTRGGVISSLTGNSTGGLAGEHSFYSVIENSFTWTDVSGNDYIGGLVGSTLGGPITNSYSKGTVSGVETFIGGLVGWCYGSNLTHCYTNAQVGSPAGGQNIGAFAGSIRYGSHTGCFWDNTINTPLAGIGYTGDTTLLDVVGLPTTSMRMQSTYAAKGWDFANLWRICDGMNPPRFQWEPLAAGDFGCPEGVELYDLLTLSDAWLMTGASVADIAPAGAPDGKVDLLDYALLAENWLVGAD